MKAIKKYFYDWNLFEIIMLPICFILPIVLGILADSAVLTIITSVVSATTSLLFTKARIEACFLVFLQITLYVIVMWQERLFGEVGYYLLAIFPAQVFALINWLRHKSKSDSGEHKSIELAKFDKKSTIIIISSQIVLSVPYYFILKALDTPLLIFSTISLCAGVAAPILLALRNFVGYFCWITKDIAAVSIWIIMLVVENSPQAPPLLALSFLFFIFDVYGVFAWLKIKKRQQQAVLVDKDNLTNQDIVATPIIGIENN